MSDFDRDPQVGRLLNDVGNEVAGYLDPRGVDMIYATVRQRRRNRMLAVGALALALLGGPTVGLALASGDGGPPPAGGASSATTPAESPSPTVSPSPTASAAPTATPAAPDGRISLDELKRAKLVLPPWPEMVTDACREGDVDFVGQPVYTDVDHDGAEETGALLQCQGLGEFKVAQVVVFDRDAGGRIVTLGQVVASAWPGRDGVDIRKLWSIDAAPGGQIRVDVGDYFESSAGAGDVAQHQWRTYGWDGRRFKQTGGATAFGPNPKVIDLSVSAGDLTMTKQPDGWWYGTLTVKVHNAGPSPGRVEVYIGGGVPLTGDGLAGCTTGSPPGPPSFDATCDAGTVAAGATRSLTLPVKSMVSPSGTLGIYVGHVNSDRLGYPDKHDDDNRDSVVVRAA